jgi:hypothetical protein
VVEYMVGNLKSGGSRLPCAKIFFGTAPENSGGTENSAENSGPHGRNCLLYVRIESAAPGLGSRN